jgi:hypothetical protein
MNRDTAPDTDGLPYENDDWNADVPDQEADSNEQAEQAEFWHPLTVLHFDPDIVKQYGFSAARFVKYLEVMLNGKMRRSRGAWQQYTYDSLQLISDRIGIPVITLRRVVGRLSAEPFKGFKDDKPLLVLGRTKRKNMLQYGFSEQKEFFESRKMTRPIRCSMDVADRLGEPAAIVLYNLQYWQSQVRGDRTRLYEGRYWRYMSLQDVVRAYKGMMSYSQIKRAVKTLELGHAPEKGQKAGDNVAKLTAEPYIKKIPYYNREGVLWDDSCWVTVLYNTPTIADVEPNNQLRPRDLQRKLKKSKRLARQNEQTPVQNEQTAGQNEQTENGSKSLESSATIEFPDAQPKVSYSNPIISSDSEPVAALPSPRRIRKKHLIEKPSAISGGRSSTSRPSASAPEKAERRAVFFDSFSTASNLTGTFQKEETNVNVPGSVEREPSNTSAFNSSVKPQQPGFLEREVPPTVKTIPGDPELVTNRKADAGTVSINHPVTEPQVERRPVRESASASAENSSSEITPRHLKNSKPGRRGSAKQPELPKFIREMIQDEIRNYEKTASLPAIPNSLLNEQVTDARNWKVLDCYGEKHKADSKLCQSCIWKASCSELFRFRGRTIEIPVSRFQNRREMSLETEHNVRKIYRDSYYEVFNIHATDSLGDARVCLENSHALGVSFRIFCLVYMNVWARSHPKLTFHAKYLTGNSARNMVAMFCKLSKREFATVGEMHFALLLGKKGNPVVDWRYQPDHMERWMDQWAAEWRRKNKRIYQFSEEDSDCVAYCSELPETRESDFIFRLLETLNPPERDDDISKPEPAETLAQGMRRVCNLPEPEPDWYLLSPEEERIWKKGRWKKSYKEDEIVIPKRRDLIRRWRALEKTARSWAVKKRREQVL